tara:strand:- start:15461 stop:15622 length:162 start_codon:yes stop_codon:yes gene_type:complete
MPKQKIKKMTDNLQNYSHLWLFLFPIAKLKFSFFLSILSKGEGKHFFTEKVVI